MTQSTAMLTSNFARQALLVVGLIVLLQVVTTLARPGRNGGHEGGGARGGSESGAWPNHSEGPESAESTDEPREFRGKGGRTEGPESAESTDEPRRSFGGSRH